MAPQWWVTRAPMRVMQRRSLFLSTRNASTNARTYASTASVSAAASFRSTPTPTATPMPPPAPGRGVLGRFTNQELSPSRRQQLDRWQGVLQFLGFNNEDDRLFRASHSVVQSCVQQCAHRNFYRALQLAPSFHGQQALLLTHVWVVHRRLNREGNRGKILQEQVFDRLWDETLLRIRFMGVPEMSVNKQLREVQQRAFTALVAYDRAMEQGPEVVGLSQALVEHVVRDKQAPGVQTATLMATYLQREMKHLEMIESDVLLNGAIPWGPILAPSPQTPPLEDENEYTLIGEQLGNWRSALDNAGKLYYWNLTTRVSQWEQPTGKELMHGAEADRAN